MDVRKRRSGYTLLEVVVATMVVVIMAGVSMPSVRVMFGSFKVHGAADTVRGAWAQARGRAIDEGRPYRFAVIPDSGYFRVAPDDASYWGGSGGQDSHAGMVLEESLPAGVHFNINGNTSVAPDRGDSLAEPGPAPVGASAYTFAITFQADGTVDQDAEVIFQMQNAASVCLCLRSMTGAVTLKTLSGGGR